MICEQLEYLSDNNVAVGTSIAINKWIQYILRYLWTKQTQMGTVS